MNKLIIADDEGKTTVVPLVRDEVTIGRKEGNTIRLTERNVSRRHARLVRANGAFIVEDLASYNGVEVNGDPVRQPQSVKNGDRITIGDYQLSLRSDRPAAGPKVGEAPIEAPDYPRLIMLGPPNPGQEFPLEEGGDLVVGRTDENAIVINHRSISRSHAKVIASEGGVCRLVDLDSANGVRVNNTDYTDVELNSGDLVELGTVRLRYVGAGEAYQFDADATVQMDTVPEDVLDDLDEGGGRSMMPIIAAVIVVGLLVVGVVALLLFGSDDGGEEVVVPENPPTGGGGTQAAAVPSTPTPSIDAVKSRARDLFEQERYDAVESVLGSLDDDRMDDEASKLLTRAKAEHANQQLYTKACDSTEPSALEKIHRTCNKIESDSRYYQRECCKTAASNYGNAQLDAASKLVKRRDFDDAMEMLEGVTEDTTIPREVRTKAERLSNQAQRRSEALASRSTSGHSPRSTSSQRRTSSGSKTSTKARSSSRPSAEDALAKARRAVVRNDQQGCIQALSRAPRSQRVVRVLVDCLYRAGRTQRACALAQRYQQSSHLRQFVQTRCR